MPKLNSFSRNNLLSLDTLTELFSTWLNQPLLDSSNPTFNNLSLTGNLNSDGIYTKKVGVGTSAGYSTLTDNNVIVEGKVGIGTTNPISKLDIETKSSTDAISFTGLSGNTELYIDIDNTNSVSNLKLGINSAESYISQTGSGDFLIKTGASTPVERIRITNSGPIGIGTSDPQDEVHLHTSLLITSPYNLPTFALSKVDHSENFSIINKCSGSAYSPTFPVAGVYFNQSGGLNVPYIFKQGPSQILRMAIGGNVGISTTYTDSDINNKLQVDGSVGIGYTTAGPVNGLIVNGKVGIGTPSPGASYLLDVNGNINFTGNLYQNGVLFQPGGGGGSDISVESPLLTSTSVSNCTSLTIESVKNILVQDERLLSFVALVQPIAINTTTKFKVTLPDRLIADFDNVYDITGTVKGFTQNTNVNIENCFLKAVTSGGSPDCEISFTSSNVILDNLHCIQVTIRYTANDPSVGIGLETPIVSAPAGSSFVNITGITVHNSKAILADTEMTFSCVISFTPISASTLSSFELTLPSRTSNFTNSYDISGSISGFTVSDINLENAFIKAVTGSPKLFVSFTSSVENPPELHYIQLIIRYTTG
jgi:hypothetical protein